MPNLRCSSLDAVWACTPSVVAPDGSIRVAQDEEASALGKMIHRLAASYVETGRMDIAGECDRDGIEHDEEVDFLAHQAVRAWEAHKPLFTIAMAERSMPPVQIRRTAWELTANLDVMSPAGKVDGVFLDFKTGRHVGHKHQMYGYALSIWDAMGRPATGKVKGIVAYLRHNRRRVVTYDAAALEAWEHDLGHNVLSRLDTYKPNPHCERCAIFASCPARREVVGSTVGALMLPGNVPADDATKAMIARATSLLAGITPDNKDEPEVRELVTALRFRVGLVENVIDKLKEVMRETVARVGPIKLDDETKLELRAVETKHVDAKKGLKPLRALLADADIAGAMKLSLPQLCNAAAAKRTRGEKRAAREQVIRDLEAAGALSVSTHHRLEEAKISDEELSDVEERASVVRAERRATGANPERGAGDREPPDGAGGVGAGGAA